MFWRVVERGGRWYPLVKQSEGGKWQIIAMYAAGFADRDAALEVARKSMKRLGGSFYDEQWTPDPKVLERWKFLKWLWSGERMTGDNEPTTTTIREVLHGRI